MSLTLPGPRLAPGTILALDQIHVEDAHYGIPVTTLCDGDVWLALGTHDPRRALAAWARHVRTYSGEPVAGYASLWLPLHPAHLRFRAPTPECGDDPESLWYYDRVPAGTPGAIPALTNSAAY